LDERVFVIRPGPRIAFAFVAPRAQTVIPLDSGRPERSAPSEGRAVGAVYTPAILAEWTAELLLRPLGDAPHHVWDLAVGEGALLAAIDRLAPGRHTLWGLDVDERALAQACKVVPRACLHKNDALATGANPPAELLIPDACEAPDAIILNPPWGAAVRHSSEELRRSGFTLATGQFDSYDLFVELALSLLARNGVIALILPDSLLRAEHRRTRRLLATSTTLDWIARLGEGFFPGVFQGTMVLVARKQLPRPRHVVRCLRLAARDRQAVLRRKVALSSLEAAAHSVPQSRFVRSPETRFDIDVSNGDRRTITRIETNGTLDWDTWMRSGRGVELSKSGEVVHCPKCRSASPRPRKPRNVQCSQCLYQFRSSEAIPDTIVTKEAPADRKCWAPLIVGEDVTRYACHPSRYIRLEVPGIRYKEPPGDQTPRLLVRKTGIGIKAAIDSSGALTNQVVFDFRPTEHGRRVPFLLDYVAGVLNSRAMLAYHIQSSGEREWRSHPYLSQSAIKALPIPAPDTDRTTLSIAERIATEVRRLSRRAPIAPQDDLTVEGLVCRLLGIDATAWAWILRALYSAQSLEGIAPLRLPLDTKLPS
jgi:hypothetical protein